MHRQREHTHAHTRTHTHARTHTHTHTQHTHTQHTTHTNSTHTHPLPHPHPHPPTHPPTHPPAAALSLVRVPASTISGSLSPCSDIGRLADCVSRASVSSSISSMSCRKPDAAPKSSRTSAPRAWPFWTRNDAKCGGACGRGMQNKN